MEYMREAVVAIRRKYLGNFEGESKVSTNWFNPDHEFFYIRFSTLEPDFYKNFMKRILKVEIWNHIKCLW